MARYAREKKRIIILNGCIPLVPPVIPSRMTFQGIHCAALRRKTIATGAVARFRGIESRRLRGGALDRGIRGSGIETDFIMKTIDFELGKDLEGVYNHKEDECDD